MWTGLQLAISQQGARAAWPAARDAIGPASLQRVHDVWGVNTARKTTLMSRRPFMCLCNRRYSLRCRADVDLMSLYTDAMRGMGMQGGLRVELRSNSARGIPRQAIQEALVCDKMNCFLLSSRHARYA